jgi:hypothetical protein
MHNGQLPTELVFEPLFIAVQLSQESEEKSMIILTSIVKQWLKDLRPAKAS